MEDRESGGTEIRRDGGETGERWKREGEEREKRGEAHREKKWKGGRAEIGKRRITGITAGQERESIFTYDILV